MSGQHPDRTSAVMLEAAARAERALDLRIRGLSYRAIAKELGVDVSQAHGYVTKALAESREKCAALADDLRELEIQKLDKLEAKLWNGLKKETDATDRAKVANALVRVVESRRKLLGLDAPQKVEMSGNLYTVLEASPECPEWGEPPKAEEKREG